MQKSAGIGNLTRVAVDQKASPFWISGNLSAVKFDWMETELNEGAGHIFRAIGNDPAFV